MVSTFSSNINPVGLNGFLVTTQQSFVVGNIANDQQRNNIGPTVFSGSGGGGALPLEAAQQNLETFTPTTFNPLAGSNASFEQLNTIIVEQLGGVTSVDDLENINLFEIQNLTSQLSTQSSFYNALQTIFQAVINQVQVSQDEVLVIKQLREDNEKLAQQLAALEADYQHLKETCADIAGEDFVEQALESSISIGTKVKIHFNILYSIYQYFFGYPCDGIFKDVYVDLIRDTLEENGIFVNEEKEVKTQISGSS